MKFVVSNGGLCRASTLKSWFCRAVTYTSDVRTFLCLLVPPNDHLMRKMLPIFSVHALIGVCFQVIDSITKPDHSNRWYGYPPVNYHWKKRWNPHKKNNPRISWTRLKNLSSPAESTKSFPCFCALFRLMTSQLTSHSISWLCPRPAMIPLSNVKRLFRSRWWVVFRSIDAVLVHWRNKQHC